MRNYRSISLLFVLVSLCYQAKAQTDFPEVANNDTALFKAASDAENARNLPRAVYYYTKALSIAKPNSCEQKRSLLYRGMNKIFLNDLFGAIDDLEGAARVKVDNCNFYAMQDNPVFEENFNALAYLLLGDCYYKKGDKTTACRFYSKSGELGMEEAYSRISKNCQ